MKRGPKLIMIKKYGERRGEGGGVTLQLKKKTILTKKLNLIKKMGKGGGG